MEGGKELWKKNRQEREIGENKEERENKNKTKKGKLLCDTSFAISS
jgi:hypothetical protein